MSSYKNTRLPIYAQLILRFLLAMLFYSIFRLLFYLFNRSYFEEAGFTDLLTIFRGGLLFDTTAVLYSNVMVIVLMILPFPFRYNKWYQLAAHYLYLIFNILCLLINTADIVYYRFIMRRTTASFFNEFKHDDNIFQIIGRGLFDYWHVTLVSIITIALFVYLAHHIRFAKNHMRSKLTFYISQTVLMAITIVLFIGGVRSGFSTDRPITLSNASKYTKSPNQRALVLNTPFAIIRTIGKNHLTKVEYFKDGGEARYFNAVHPSCVGDTTITTKPNIVIIVLESFGRSNFGYLNKDIPGYKGFTPFLDSLSQHCYSFKNAFANGRNSIDALPSIITSIPTINESFILSDYSGNSINSLANLLKPQGYYSAFFHGAPNGSMGFDAFMQQAGYDDYFGKTEYNNDDDDDGYWGLWDEPFLQYFANSMGSFKEPFLTTVFTLSSHHPFQVPKQYEGVFPKGEIPLQECIGYTDNALRNFFNTCKRKPWFNNTLFVITADHMSNNAIDKYNNDWGTFAIPMMLYMPGKEDFTGFDDSTYVQQIDVMPTIMNLVGNKEPYISFGQDMFDKDADRFVFTSNSGSYLIIKDGYLLQFNGQESIGLYNIRTDEFMKNNLISTNDSIQKQMENHVKAIIQDYSNRMIDNNLTIKQSAE
ncbi:MAG: LTA synthase family protein [Bacteroidales bacterium]